MALHAKTINVPPGGEIARHLDEAAAGPLVLEKEGVRYHLNRQGTAEVPEYDPAAALAGIRDAGGSWRGINAEALKPTLYRARTIHHI